MNTEMTKANVESHSRSTKRLWPERGGDVASKCAATNNTMSKLWH